MPDRITPVLLREARRLGAEGLRITHGGKHPRLNGQIDGRPFIFVHPYSASDWRSVKNSLSDLRRLLRDLAPRFIAAHTPPRAARGKRPRKDCCKPEPIYGVMPGGRADARRDSFYGPLQVLKSRLFNSDEDGGHREHAAPPGATAPEAIKGDRE